jgi:hypothetical protein
MLVYVDCFVLIVRKELYYYISWPRTLQFLELFHVRNVPSLNLSWKIDVLVYSLIDFVSLFGHILLQYITINQDCFDLHQFEFVIHTWFYNLTTYRLKYTFGDILLNRNHVVQNMVLYFTIIVQWARLKCFFFESLLSLNLSAFLLAKLLYCSVSQYYLPVEVFGSKILLKELKTNSKCHSR